ncbi:hypothetical protein EUGRSUZ_B01340 [Eucalyptus grandis]|uniref:Uncharacterized protein n=2 Tax=Eucalyptus grandis TaxID=71139 RepID=A0ACC3LQR2_EUCGR|nr:hypothetical protein EUGRSUZ_B01340 [Eucalyptus grandis]
MVCNLELPVSVLVRNLVLPYSSHQWGSKGNGKGRGSGNTSKNATNLSSPDADDDLEPPTRLLDTMVEWRQHLRSDILSKEGQ